ncbi:uncharacterized protein SPSK_00541 [Sporothrix schenckii 1099-18]|uniref:Uncharacterized protein n=1 Tax=Sporothrix schenckii 1099-18 TaxID=1397361 RepID=A0A0F2LT28_SPOSC|nr:uncharacterized protein SPSK_00541 [Sporothrix schenckii 1099-18]KJR80009.1 hypothetical protein SPSK_00541 [Sporothrix schenckii 1099-18]
MDLVSPPETPSVASPSGRQPATGPHNQPHSIHHAISSSPRYPGPNGLGPRASITPKAVSTNKTNELSFRASSARPDKQLPHLAGSSINGTIGHNLTTKVEDADDADGDDDEDQSDSDSDSVTSGSISKSSSSAELSSPPITSRPAPLRRRAGRTSGSASPAYTPGEGRVKSSETRRPSFGGNATQFSTRLLVVEAALVIEEISDFDSDNGRIQVILPYEIEEAESERERTPDPNHNRSGKLNAGRAQRRRSSARLSRLPEIDRSVMSGLRGFSFRNDSDEEALIDEDEEDGSDFDENAHNLFRLKQRAERRRRRMTSGSISKRTISESIGSDTDNEDLMAMLDESEVGSSARRLRRRIGDRHSLQFQDPPPPRIDELEEPDTSDNEDDVKELTRDGETLARELPYYTLEYISMEVDSP